MGSQLNSTELTTGTAVGMNIDALLIGIGPDGRGGYAPLWLGYLAQWTWLAAMDSSALEPAYRFGVAHPAWVTAWDVFCTVVSPGLFRILLWS